MSDETCPKCGAPILEKRWEYPHVVIDYDCKSRRYGSDYLSFSQSDTCKIAERDRHIAKRDRRIAELEAENARLRSKIVDTNELGTQNDAEIEALRKTYCYRQMIEHFRSEQKRFHEMRFRAVELFAFQTACKYREQEDKYRHAADAIEAWEAEQQKGAET